MCVCVSKRPCINVVHTHNYEIQEKKKRFFFFSLNGESRTTTERYKKPQIIIAIQEKTAIMEESKLFASLLQSVDPFFSTVPLSSLPFLSLFFKASKKSALMRTLTSCLYNSMNREAARRRS